MNLIQKFEDLGSAQRVQAQLAQVGILSHVVKNGSSLFGLGSEHVALFSILEGQHVDAIEYLKNKNHRVTNSLSKSEFAKFNNELNQNVYHLVNKAIVFGAAIILLVSVVMVLKYGI